MCISLGPCTLTTWVQGTHEQESLLFQAAEGLRSTSTAAKPPILIDTISYLFYSAKHIREVEIKYK